MHSITSFIGIVLVIGFFVTSSDSGSLLIDIINAGGKVDAADSHHLPPDLLGWSGGSIG